MTITDSRWILSLVLHSLQFLVIQYVFTPQDVSTFLLLILIVCPFMHWKIHLLLLSFLCVVLMRCVRANVFISMSSAGSCVGLRQHHPDINTKVRPEKHTLHKNTNMNFLSYSIQTASSQTRQHHLVQELYGHMVLQPTVTIVTPR